MYRKAQWQYSNKPLFAFWRQAYSSARRATYVRMSTLNRIVRIRPGERFVLMVRWCVSPALQWCPYYYRALRWIPTRHRRKSVVPGEWFVVSLCMYVEVRQSLWHCGSTQLASITPSAWRAKGSSRSIHGKHLATVNRATSVSVVIRSMNRDAFQVQHPCRDSTCHLSSSFSLSFSLQCNNIYKITFIYCINKNHDLLAFAISLLANPFHRYAALHLYILFVSFMFEGWTLSVWIKSSLGLGVYFRGLFRANLRKTIFPHDR